jgi:uncharacterized protein DUF6249
MVNAETFIPFLIFAIPIIAIVGGITAGIVKTLGRQRLMELAQQERIAAIQRGVDPGKLPPLPTVALDDDEIGLLHLTPAERDRRRSQGLMIAGLITLFAGIGVLAFLMLLDPESGRPIWAVGLIPGFVGAALLLSAWLVRPHGGTGAPPAV